MRPGAQRPPGAAGSLLAVLSVALLGLWAGCAAIYIVAIPPRDAALLLAAPEPAASASSQPLRDFIERTRERKETRP